MRPHLRTPVLLLATLAVAAPLRAQVDHYVSSPVGFEYAEGAGESRDLLGTERLLRYQQIDSTTLTALTNRSRIAFRRDGQLPPSAEYGPRTIELEVLFAESDIAALSPVFISNYKANAVTVVTRKRVQFPDWSAMPVQPPAPLDAVLPLDQTWSYAGKLATGNDWLWEVRVFDNDQAGKEYPFDLDYVVPNAVFGQLRPTRSGHIDLGSGCQVPVRGESHMDIDIWNHKAKFTLDAHLHTVANAPVAFTLGFFNANLSLPGFCTKIYALPGVSFLAGVADPNGDLDLSIDPIPYNPGLIGTDFYVQAAAPDPSQTGVPIALSSGAVMTVPPDPRGPAIGRLWSKNPNASFATFGPIPGGIILHTTHP